MSLLEDVKGWYRQNSYPPYDLEDAEIVSEEVLGKARWGSNTEYVIKRGDEYVAIRDVAPATEMQDWGDYGDPEIYVVEPYTVSVTKYRKV